MLRGLDAGEKTDRAMAARVRRWTRQAAAAVSPLPYSTNLKTATLLRELMERSGRRGEVRPASIDTAPAFFYVCAYPDGRPFAQGVGATPALAICDAFRNCDGDPELAGGQPGELGDPPFSPSSRR